MTSASAGPIKRIGVLTGGGDCPGLNAASVMGVAAVGWVAMTLNSSGPDVAQLAALKKPQPVVASVADSSGSARLAAASAEPTVREYLIAHQAMGPSAAMPGVALYVRSVSDTRAAGER